LASGLRTPCHPRPESPGPAPAPADRRPPHADSHLGGGEPPRRRPGCTQGVLPEEIGGRL
jgi:hypothetical protein